MNRNLLWASSGLLFPMLSACNSHSTDNFSVNNNMKVYQKII